MPWLTIQVSGGAALQEKIQRIAASINEVVASSVDMVCEETAALLADAAPKGESASSGEPLPGDAPGHLYESFTSVLDGSEAGVYAAVVCTQPNKLELVRQGTGEYGPRHARITPRQKRALYWEGAENPYASVAGMRPNDFVTPVLETVSERLRAQVAADLRALLES